MEEICESRKNKQVKRPALVDFVFSWSIKDALNKHLFKNKVKKIPCTFSSICEYLNSFHYPLIEETRAEFCSGLESVAQSPSCEIFDLRVSKNFKLPKGLYYKIRTKQIMDLQNNNNNNNGGHYELQSGDLIALTNVRPQKIEDFIITPNKFFVIAFVAAFNSDKSCIEILCSQEIKALLRSKKNERIFATFLMNMTTSLRIWDALNPHPKSITMMSLVKKVLQYDSAVDDDDCSTYMKEEILNIKGLNVFELIGSFDLDESQRNAILSTISMAKCSHKTNNVKLIWGPPGTGKTKTVASLLFILMKMKHRTLTCAPTNVAVVQVAKRLVSHFFASIDDDLDTYGLGDIVLFGNEERMKINDHEELANVFLDHRIQVLEECLEPFNGWRHTLESMKQSLVDSQGQYKAYLQETMSGDVMTFEEFFMKNYNSLADRLVYCIKNLYSHLPTSVLPLAVAKQMIRLVSLLKTLKIDRRKVCRFTEHVSLMNKKEEILCMFKKLSDKFPKLDTKGNIWKFCLLNARLIFCTASSCIKVKTNVELVIIDEAAQLKECESAISLQLPGLRNALLIGDDRQLPAMVQSKLLGELNFGRSLFQRLATLGKKKHLLKTQYRMHPSISLFPNKEFYENKIIDAPNVKEKSYSKSFLEGSIYGSYSFINVSGGKEDFEYGRSPRNIEEATVVERIIAKLSKGHDFEAMKLSVGVISPYKGQVRLIQDKIGKKYANYNENFTVNIRSVDGFQGGEEDIIIISTVRCNRNGSVGFLSNHQRTNVALTRARYCLWIVGNGTTLANSGSVWKNVVINAKIRGCFNNADDLDLKQARIGGFVMNHDPSTSKLDFFGSLNFRGANWKVLFSDTFKTSISNIRSEKLQKQVQEILKNIAGGWYNPNYKEVLAVNNSFIFSKAYELLQHYKLDEDLYLIWTVDIMKEDFRCTQVIKVWDILPSSNIPKLAKELSILFDKYTLDFMNRCKYKAFEGNLLTPMSWPLHLVVGVDEHLLDRLSAMSIRDRPDESSSRSIRKNYSKTGDGTSSTLRRRQAGKTTRWKMIS